jgi:hypothetical protein
MRADNIFSIQSYCTSHFGLSGADFLAQFELPETFDSIGENDALAPPPAPKGKGKGSGKATATEVPTWKKASEDDEGGAGARGGDDGWRDDEAGGGGADMD